MAKYGAATSASSILSAFFLNVAGVSSSTAVGEVVCNAMLYGFLGGAGVFALASLPLIGAGFYGLKRLAA